MDEHEFYNVICMALGVGRISEDDIDRVVLLVKSGFDERNNPVDVLCGKGTDVIASS